MPFAHGESPPAPGLPGILVTWPIEPLVWLAAGLTVWWYVRAARRLPAWPGVRRGAFLLGASTILVALASPVALYADALFSVHMIQHLLLTLIGAPLLLLGAPATLALRTSSPAGRSRLVGVLHSPPVRAVTHPVVAWSLFAAVMWATHFTPFYDAALESYPLHVLEHVLYLGAALLFWAPVVGLDPARVHLSHPARLGYLLLALPQQSFLGLALYSTSAVLYPHYGTLGRNWGPAPLDDQRAGALVMWLGGDVLFVAAFILAAIAWMRHDEREAARLDRRAGW